MIELLGGMGALLAGRVLSQRLARMEEADRHLGRTIERGFEATARAFRDGDVAPARAARTPEVPREAWSDPESFRRLVQRTGPADGPLRSSARVWALSSFGVAFPWTPPHARAFSEFQKDVAALLVAGLGHHELVARPALIAGAGWEVTEREGRVYGFAPALAADEAAWWIKARMRPELGELRAPSVTERVAAVRRALMGEGAVTLSGIPPYVQALVEVLSEEPETAAALRRLRLYVWTGLGLGPARRPLQDRLGSGLRFADAASSAEGPLGLPTDQAGVYRLAARQALHLFVPDRDPGERLFGHELEVGEVYGVWITSTAGVVAWDTGDRIRVHATRPLRFSFAPTEVDAADVGAALGTANFRLCLGDAPSLIVEEGAQVQAASSVLPAATSVRTVARGAIPRAVLRLGLEGVPKVPWVHHDAALQRRIEALVGG